MREGGLLASDGERKRWRELAALAGALAFAALALHVAGIGCPIKFLTGILCPGCGMTRAWLAVLGLRFDLAGAYHPLFFLVPVAFAACALRERMPAWLFKAVIVGCTAALLAVWTVRLANGQDASLFSANARFDVVGVSRPAWVGLVVN